MGWINLSRVQTYSWN